MNRRVCLQLSKGIRVSYCPFDTVSKEDLAREIDWIAFQTTEGVSLTLSVVSHTRVGNDDAICNCGDVGCSDLIGRFFHFFWRSPFSVERICDR